MSVEGDDERWISMYCMGHHPVEFILLFYLMMGVLEPQSQGVTRMASSFKGRIVPARTEGRNAFLILMTMVGIVLVASILGLGAMLLPGMTLGEVFKAVTVLTESSVVSLALVILCLLVTMRHLQGVASRWMAINILTARLDRLRDNVLIPLVTMGEVPLMGGEEMLNELKREYYSIVIYDIVEHDFFGRSQVYMVGPRLRYVLDDRVLALLK